MQQWVKFRYGGHRGHVGELLGVDGEELSVRMIGPGGAEDVVTTTSAQVESVDDLVGAVRAWIGDDHGALASAQRFAFWVERVELPADDLAGEWDAYLTHEEQVGAQVDARKADALGTFDQELAALPAADLMAAIFAEVPRWLPYAGRPAGDMPDEASTLTIEARLLASLLGEPEQGPSRWDRARERKYAAEEAAEGRGYQEWKASLARAEGHAARRTAAADRVRRDRPVIERRFRAEWGVDLPDSIFTFWEFVLSLGPVQRQAFDQDLELSMCGILDFFDDPTWYPADGDARMHWRYYWDPPEFLTFLNGSYPAEHYGLWFDDGRSCAGVVGHSPKDNSDFGLPDGVTPLQVVRDQIEVIALHDDGSDEPKHHRLRLLRDTLMEYETGDWPEQGNEYILRSYPHRDGWYGSVDATRVTTLDGAGALVTGETVLPRGPQQAGEDRALTERIRTALTGDRQALAAGVAEAKRRCAAGDPAEALALGRDLHFISDDGAVRRNRIADHERYAAELLVMAYRALGRDNLAELAALDHHERDIPWAGVSRR